MGTTEGIMEGITEQLWDFPADFLLKTIGYSDAPLVQIVTQILHRHVSDFDETTIKLKKSKKGKYTSVSATLVFTCKAEVENVYRELNDHPAIVWGL